MHYYTATQILTPDHGLQQGFLAVENGRVSGILPEAPANVSIKNLGEGILAPGFFDVHIHGYGDCDVMDLKKESMCGLCQKLPDAGVTSFFATPLTASPDTLEQACRLLREVIAEHPQGAKIRGIFLEGPFFNPTHRGAQNPTYMEKPSLSMLERWQNAAGGWIRKIAIAPELPGSLAFIRGARRMGIHVALGHTAATYEECRAAVEAGASTFVHCYNAMSPLHHRKPGTVGAALDMSETYAECICDGIHVHPAAARLLFRAKGAAHVALITDGMRAGGMPDGWYNLGDFPVYVKNGAARLADGSLAGSVLQMKQAVQNVVDWGAATLEEALYSATAVPAASAGLAGEVGALCSGMPADFVHWKNGTVVGVWIDGKKVR